MPKLKSGLVSELTSVPLAFIAQCNPLWRVYQRVTLLSSSQVWLSVNFTHQLLYQMY